MNTFPKKLKIGGHIYKVKLVDPEEIGEDCGECDRSLGIIKINNSMPSSQLYETLLHEVIHAIHATLREEEVDMLSALLYQVIKDNKLVFD